jgi:hypothetical protein
LVKFFTAFFGVAKADFDIHMVYAGTLSGLNNVLWAHRFSLPNINTFIRIVETGTFMGEADIVEMFLKFFLDPNLKKFAGVDLTKFFPEHGGEGEVWWARWPCIALVMWS